jgi:glycosyltransferase involved in cell wall biosynthesis
MRSLFCAPRWPRFPGHSGGEIRDFHLVRALAERGPLEFFAFESGDGGAGQQDLLRERVAAVHTPAGLRSAHPEWRLDEPLAHKVVDRLARRLRRARLPVPGRRYHLDAETLEVTARYNLLPAIRHALQSSPDFLFVSPQTNPLGLLVGDTGPTRLVLASYDVERIRTRRLADAARGLARIALGQEAARAERFERENLAAYDGVIAVSANDRERFVQDYGLPPERVVAIENGVDPDYFAFTPRRRDAPPTLVFVGHMLYAPNADAARRLLSDVVPRVRAAHPHARVVIVGEGAPPDVQAAHDGVRTTVTGRVPDVRKYLAGADVACYPLAAGSGTKFKVVEALAAGVPVVASPLASEGIEVQPGLHLRVGAGADDIAREVLDLLAHPGEADRMARAGRDRVVERHAWSAVLPALGDWLDRLRGMPRREARERA